ncbi:MAG: LEA type 2 family protein [Myxococcota bacterium]
MRWWTLVSVGLLGLAGCTDPKSMKDLKKLLPEVTFQDLKVDHIDFQGLDAKIVLDVKNPYPVGLDLSEASWKLGLSGSPFLDGTNDKGLSVEANDTGKLRLPFSLQFEDAFRVVTQSQGLEQLPYTFDADLGFDTPIGNVNIPFAHQGDLPALHVPKVSLTSLRVGGIDLAHQTASVEVGLKLQSDQPSALSFDTFGYDLLLAGKHVADGQTKIGAVEGVKEVTLPVDIKLLEVGSAIVNILQSHDPVNVRLKADAQVGTPFGAVPFAVDQTASLTPR